MEKTQTQHPSKPAAWPGAFGLYKPSSEAVKRNLSTFLLVWAISIIGELVAGAIFGRHQFITHAISVLLGSYIGAATVYAVLASVRASTIEPAAALSAAGPVFLKLFVLNLLVGLTVVGGLILLIVPGLIFAVRLSVAQYYLLDHNLGILDAYKASWNATRGHTGKVWGIIGVCVLMVLPVFTVIGVIATVYLLFMYQAATGLLYEYLQKSE